MDEKVIDFHYFKHPDYCSKEKPAFVTYFAFYLSYLGIAIVLFLLIYIVSKGFHLHHINLEHNHKLILYGVFGAPVIEEILFRSLLRFRMVNIILFTVVNVVLIIGGFIHGKIIFATAFIFFLVALYMILSVFGREKTEQFIAGHFKYFFYGSAIIFGLLHALNFSGNVLVIILFSPVLGSPQLLAGFILGYFRMKHGLVWSMLFHFLVNLFILLQLL